MTAEAEHPALNLSLLEQDTLRALMSGTSLWSTAPQIALAVNVELPKALSILNTLRRLGLAHPRIVGMGTDTLWALTELGERELARAGQLRLIR